MNAPSRIVLGVSGSIAAYKAADLASKLVQAGFAVHPVLTTSAARFIGPATFTAITGNPCPVGVFDEPYPGEISHIKLAQEADLFVVAPASANLIARLAHGQADDMLSASLLATKAPVLIAPAMNTGMWEHPATMANMSTLRNYGCHVVDPASGMLACGTEGVGKMAPVEAVFDRVQALLAKRHSWSGVRVLVTAGPTREPVDPVRFLSNRSSGKMGYALAEEAAARGASVTLVSGPTHLPCPPNVALVSVETTAEMAEAVLARAATADVIIAAAAPADFRPSAVAAQKIKKSGAPPSIALEKTTDILAAVGAAKRSDQVLVGFAAETENLLENARAKLAAKDLDWIVANDVTQAGAGFDADTNIVTLLGPEEQQIALTRMPKRAVAVRILDNVRPTDTR
jgi:phosphopantothenoylcysteine decarboxylase/phosphopantothenate--cysteine ligase